jgi:hypothetical protein
VDIHGSVEADAIVIICCGSRGCKDDKVPVSSDVP